MSQKNNYLTELYTNSHNFMLGLVLLCMHLLLNLINQTIDIQEKIKIVKKKIYVKVNGELFSCDIKDSGRVPSREGDVQNFA